ncbi:MAG: hypothetical protein EZS28_000075 [Streblomastix strix]|uniref:Uncharacterized protein n=1 Tax=Streblomastix strix TaxID=222440 RepID=A0A5J4XAU3_9EUKA|nr:MAG: hypothetical protein EZS28_000075 [Streblomastix strix]
MKNSRLFQTARENYSVSEQKQSSSDDTTLDLLKEEGISCIVLQLSDEYWVFFDEQESLEAYAQRIGIDGECGDGRLLGSNSDAFHKRIGVNISRQPEFSEGEQYHRTIRPEYMRKCYYKSI